MSKVSFPKGSSATDPSTTLQRLSRMACALTIILPKKPAGLRALLKNLLRSPIINAICIYGCKNICFFISEISSFIVISRMEIHHFPQ